MEIINALEIVEEFERAQIITGSRLNGRTYAYKCGLEDGKRKALEQQPSEDYVSLAEVFEIIGNLLSIPYDFDRQITEKDVSESMDKIKALTPVTSTHGTCKECKYSSVHTISLDEIDEIRVCRIQFSRQIKDDYYCANYEKRGNENEIN